MMLPAQLPLALKLRAASSLSSFIPGENTLLLAALSALGRAEPGQLYLWGESGAGRSHLLEGKIRDAGSEGCFLAAAGLVKGAEGEEGGIDFPVDRNNERVLIDLVAGQFRFH